MNSPSSNNKTVNKMVTDVEPKNNFEYDELSMIEDTLNQFSTMTAHSSSNTSESSNFVSKLFIFHLNIT